MVTYKPNVVRFQLITYDVWGNPKDGYEVNDLYPKGVVEIPESVLEIKDTDSFNSFEHRLMTFMRRSGIFYKIPTKCMIIEGEPAYTLYFTRRRDHYPICELRRET